MSNSLEFTRRRLVTTGFALTAAFPLQRAASALGFAPETPVCRLAAEQEVGPYYVADELLRSNIVEGKPGVPLSLRLLVLDARTCQPLPNAAIDLWHCDALGLYAGFTKQNPMGPGGPPPGFDPQHPGNRPGPPEGMGPPPENHPTDHLTFLRGIQMTDSNGTANFQTIFPGVYMGRTNHIHFKVRVGGQITGKSYGVGYASHTGQVFFPENLATQLMKQEPYLQHNIHRTTQAEDAVYQDQQGETSVARITFRNQRDFAAGLHAELITAVDPSTTPKAAQRRGGPGQPLGRPPRPDQ